MGSSGETAAKNFWPAFWIMAAGHELATSLVDYEGKELADYGFDPLNLKPEDPEIEDLGEQGAQQWPPGNGRRCWHDRPGAGYRQIHFLKHADACTSICNAVRHLFEFSLVVGGAFFE